MDYTENSSPLNYFSDDGSHEKEKKRLEALKYKIYGIDPKVSAEDLDRIVTQLGYQPSNLIQVAAYNQAGLPSVLQLYPLRCSEKAYKVKHRTTMEPFPTIYWLCCPELKRDISILEVNGWILRLQDRINNNSLFRQEFEENHRQYAAERWAILDSRDRYVVEKRNLSTSLQKVGVAGIRDFRMVKCLHTHYAHFLVHGLNIVGKWVHELLQQNEHLATIKSNHDKTSPIRKI